MRPSILFALTALLLHPIAIRADGCKFKRNGHEVPEHEQRAFVEWENGTETLHVAALSEPTSDGTVWVVPVRARAAAVRAEPVEEFPAVVYYETVAERTRESLRNAILTAGVLDSGGLCCPVLPGMGCGSPGSAATEFSRIERLGMVVTVVRADDRAELARYLDRQGVDSSAADLRSLEPYFGQDGYAFVCGWVADRAVPATAAALKVTFASPNVWFPLRPTNLYANPVRTVVYVRGFVRPAEGCDLDGLACEYVYGLVEPKDVLRAFAPRADREYYPFASHKTQRVTRVTLATDPRKWDRDLELVPGTAWSGTKPLVIDRALSGGGWPASAILGALLGLLLPWGTVARAERKWSDWVSGALTGAALVGSLWLSALVFVIWRSTRFSDRSRQPSRYVALPLLAAAHFGIVYAVCCGLMEWVAAP